MPNHKGIFSKKRTATLFENKKMNKLTQRCASTAACSSLLELDLGRKPSPIRANPDNCMAFMKAGRGMTSHTGNIPQNFP